MSGNHLFSKVQNQCGRLWPFSKGVPSPFYKGSLAGWQHIFSKPWIPFFSKVFEEESSWNTDSPSRPRQPPWWCAPPLLSPGWCQSPWGNGVTFDVSLRQSNGICHPFARSLSNKPALGLGLFATVFLILNHLVMAPAGYFFKDFVAFFKAWPAGLFRPEPDLYPKALVKLSFGPFSKDPPAFCKDSLLILLFLARPFPKGFLGEVVSFFKDLLGEVLPFFKDLLGEVFPFFKDLLGEVFPFFKNFLGEVSGFFKDLLGEVFPFFKGFFQRGFTFSKGLEAFSKGLDELLGLANMQGKPDASMDTWEVSELPFFKDLVFSAMSIKGSAPFSTSAASAASLCFTTCRISCSCLNSVFVSLAAAWCNFVPWANLLAWYIKQFSLSIRRLIQTFPEYLVVLTSAVAPGVCSVLFSKNSDEPLHFQKHQQACCNGGFLLGQGHCSWKQLHKAPCDKESPGSLTQYWKLCQGQCMAWWSV